MTGMRKPYSRPRTTFASLILRIGGVAVAAIVTAEVFVLVDVYNVFLPPEFLIWSSVIGIGMVCGLWARFLLRKNTSLLRVLAALIGLMSALLVQNLITNGDFGVNLLQANSSPNWLGLAQLGLGAFSALLALRAWHKAVRVVHDQPSVAATQQISQPVRPAGRTRLAPNGRGNSTSSVSVTTSSPVRSNGRRSLGNLLSSPGRMISDGFVRLRNASPVIKRGKFKRARSGLRFFNRAKPVQFSNVQTHVCPYCLEELKENEPGGVEKCNTCGTYHHADCWVAGGSICQVPHLQE